MSKKPEDIVDGRSKQKLRVKSWRWMWM